LAEFVLHGDKSLLEQWNNQYLIYLKSDDLESLLPNAVSHFREPDLDNKITGIATFDEEITRELSLI